MARVRPGVELVLASLEPTSELMTLDFPTFERPRKATSGNPGAGKWATSLAESKNRERTRTDQFQGSVNKPQAEDWCRFTRAREASCSLRPSLSGAGTCARNAARR